MPDHRIVCGVSRPALLHAERIWRWALFRRDLLQAHRMLEGPGPWWRFPHCEDKVAALHPCFEAQKAKPERADSSECRKQQLVGWLSPNVAV
jgi:hypothetical protein